MLQAKHKSGEGTVVLKESDVGYLVTVHKEQLPPHYYEEFDYYEDALAAYAQMTVEFGDGDELSEITRIVNEQADPAATEGDVLVALLDLPEIDDVESAAQWIIETTW